MATTHSILTFEDSTHGQAPTLTGAWHQAGAGTSTAHTGAAIHGTLGVRWPDMATYSALEYTGAGLGATLVVDMYVTLRSIGANTVIAETRTAASGGTILAQLRIMSNRTVMLRNVTASVGQSTQALDLDTPYRLAWRLSSTGQEVRVYAGESTTALFTVAGALTSNAAGALRIGATASSTCALDADTIRLADDWLDPYATAPPALHTHFTVSGGTLVPLQVKPATATTPWTPWQGMKLVAAASQGGTGSNWWTAFQTLDADLAAAAGEATPFLAGQHTYSGSNFPSTFAATTASGNPGYGLPYSVLNVKCPWDQLADGTLDTKITGFVNSIPAGHTVYLIINHEPENDGNPLGAATWCTGQARAANLIASLDDPRCVYAVCHMSYTWDPASGRNPQDWNPVNGGTITMTQVALDRAVFAPDGYTKIYNAAGTNVKLMGQEFDACFNAAAAWGFTRLAISEHSLNNDAGAPVSVVVPIWENDHLPYILSKKLEYYAIYNSEGPASGTNSKLDTPEELAMMSTFVKDVRDGIRR